MIPMNRLPALVLAALITATPLTARAANCTASATGVAFGTYLPAAATNSTGQVTVRCSDLLADISYSIAISAGGGSFAERQMTSGTTTLSYQLYADPARTTVWGDGSGGTAIITDGYSPAPGTITRNYSVYGRIPAGQRQVTPGTYADTITVTVIY